MTRHAELIARLCAESGSIHTRRWMRDLRRAYYRARHGRIGRDEDAARLWADDVDGGGQQGKLVPDAHMIDAARRQCVLYEVDDTSRQTPHKLRAYSSLWFDMDCVEWGLTLVRVDRDYQFGIYNLPGIEWWCALNPGEHTYGALAAGVEGRSGWFLLPPMEWSDEARDLCAPWLFANR